MQARAAFVGILVCAVSALAQPSPPLPPAPFERTIASGDVQNYSLHIADRQIVRIFLLQTLPFEVTVQLQGPAGQTVVERRSRQNLIVSAAPPAPGEYRLEIAAPKTPAPASGSYVIRTIEIRAAAPGDDALLQADADYSEYRRAAAASSDIAAAKLDAAASLYERTKQPVFQGWTLLLAGQYWVRQSDYSKAAARYAASAATFLQAQDKIGRANALDFLGDISAVLRDYPKAIEAASDSLTLVRSEHLPDLEIGALVILGRAYSQLGEKQRALDFFQEAIALARREGNRTREAVALSAAANLNNSLGNHEKALAYYQDALVIQRASGAKLNEAAALSNIGSSYASLGQHAKATDYFQQAIALFRVTQGGRPALATTLADCGEAFLASKEPAKAVPLLEEALTIARENANRWSESFALMHLGRARFAMGVAPAAATDLAAALSIVREIGDPQLEAAERHEIAELELARGNLAAAREQAAASVDLVESLRNRVAVPDLRSSFVASVSEYYELHVDILMRLYRQNGGIDLLRDAREAAERRRARNLLDVLSAAGIQPDAAGNPELSAREQTLRQNLNRLAADRIALLRVRTPPARMAAVDRQIDEAWTAYQSARAALLAADPKASWLADPGTAALSTVEAQKGLGADSLLLEYSLGTKQSYLWVISQNEIHGYDLPGRASIEEAARRFWEAVKAGGDPASVEQAASRLTQLVLVPAAGLLGDKRLLIVPDGALEYVPFTALADPKAKAYRPLLLSHEVVSEPSASTLTLLRREQAGREHARRTLAVFADPVFEASDPRIRRATGAPTPSEQPPEYLTRAADLRLARLPATRAEGISIGSLVPESERWLALDFAASRTAATSAQLKDYAILHFATHGVVETTRPEMSALALSLFDSRGVPQDGFLRLYEIYGMKIQADLVVLSACDTALGKEVRGEGLVGLARGFMHAGSPRVVASLWKVDDRSTSELMRLFYAAMLGRDHKRPAAALREAQLAIARQERWRSPYYWAAFQLQGEWR